MAATYYAVFDTVNGVLIAYGPTDPSVNEAGQLVVLPENCQIREYAEPVDTAAFEWSPEAREFVAREEAPVLADGGAGEESEPETAARNWFTGEIVLPSSVDDAPTETAEPDSTESDTESQWA